MNSALQCLSNVPGLTGFFRSDSWKKDLNTKNPLGMKGEIAESYAELMKTLWGGRTSLFAPKTFKGVVGRLAPQFSESQLHASQELMAFLLKRLHEDLNRIKKKPYVLIESSNGKPDEEAAQQAWDDSLMRNDSIIIDLFHGQLKETVYCFGCENKSKTFDPFSYLSLPIPIPKRKTLKIHFKPSDSHSLPVKCQVKVPSDGVFTDLYEAVAKMFNIPEGKKLLAAEVHRQRFHCIYQDSASLRNTRDSDQIFVYEVDDHEDEVPIILYFKEIESTRYQMPGTITCPAIVSVPDDLSFDQLYDFIRKYQTIVTDAEANSYFSHNHNAGIVAAKTEEPTAICSSPTESDQPPLFKIRSVNQYGSPAFDSIPHTGSINLTPLSYLSVEFDKELMGSLTNTPNAMDEADHESLNEQHTEPSVTLEDCVELFSSEFVKHHKQYCPVCDDHVQTCKQFALWKLPKYLVIQLNRYKSSMSSNSYDLDKVDTLVKYPLRNLDLTPRVMSNHKGEKWLYDLIAVSNHYAGLGGGHCTAYGKNHILDKWFHFDDSSVSSASENSVMNKSVYLLVYERQH